MKLYFQVTLLACLTFLLIHRLCFEKGLSHKNLNNFSSRTSMTTTERASMKYNARNISRTRIIPNYIKNPLKEGDAMTLLHNLCMEPNNGVGKLVLYNAKRNGSMVISVPKGPANWTVELSTLPLPDKDIYTYDHAAYFVTSRYNDNWYHFWIDMANGLYGAMKVTKTLGSNIPSQLYYYSDVRAKRHSSFFVTRFQDILFALPVKKEHIYYKKAKPHSCFHNAIFGYYDKGYSLKEKYDYFMKTFNITCQPSRSNRIKVTLINRKVRSISNIDELKKMSEQSGFQTKVVDLGSLPLREQFALIMCDTDILVGVQGAGLRWIDFLPPKKSALLELTWQYWESLYARQASSQGKKSATLAAKTVTLDLHKYFKAVHREASPHVTNDLLAQYQKKGPESSIDNHWKWANGTFDPKIFAEKLKFVSP